VKVLAFSSPLWKRGVGGDFIIKIRRLISMCCIFIKSPSIPLFQRGKSKTEYFHSILRAESYSAPWFVNSHVVFYKPTFLKLSNPFVNYDFLEHIGSIKTLICILKFWQIA